MRVFAFLFLLGTAYCAKLDKTYLPPGASSAGGDGQILSAPVFDQTPGSGVISAKSNVYSHSPASVNSGHSHNTNNAFAHSSSGGHTQTRFTSQAHNHQQSAFGSRGSQYGSNNNNNQYGNTNQHNGQGHAQAQGSRSGSGSGSFTYGNQGNAYSQNYMTREQVPILKYSNENNQGQYRYAYETGNGIMAQEEGYQKDYDTQEVTGSYSYTSPEGEQISVHYIANENGFQPVGPHIPTPPPIPEAILKSIKFNQEQEARGLIDDGSYRNSDSQVSNKYLAPKSGSYQTTPKNQYLAPAVSSRFSGQQTPNNQYISPVTSRQSYNQQPTNQYLAPKTAAFVPPKSNSQYTAPKPSNQYLAPRNQTPKPTNRYLAPEVTTKSVSNQYLAPRQQSFNEKTGYHY